VQIAKAVPAQYAPCKPCGGRGWGKWYADRGRCWTCNATGVVPVAFDGINIEAEGFVARPRAIERGTAEIAEILIVKESVRDNYRMTIITRKIDGEVTRWTTVDQSKASAAMQRAMQACGRDMTEARVAELVTEFGVA
jgi:hypothetical protein